MAKVATEKPLVSILTPSYNNGKFLHECIDSVLSQDYPKVEHIIQDGASTDNTLHLLKKYSRKPYATKIRWVSEKDRGETDALNRALKRARGDILLVLNADDALMPYACSWAVKEMAKHKEATAIYGDEYIINDQSRVVGIYPAPTFDYGTCFCVETIPPAQATFIRKRDLEKVGYYFDETIPSCADYELLVRLGLYFPIYHRFGVTTRYRWHESSKSQTDRLISEFVYSKKTVIDRVLTSPTTPKHIKALRSRAWAGLYAWAAKTYKTRSVSQLVYLWQAYLLQPNQKTLYHLIRWFWQPFAKKNIPFSFMKYPQTRFKKLNKPLISIVTPCYNAGSYLEECIESVLSQDYPNVEHIIQDGSSTDRTVRILKKYQQSKYNNRIRIFSEKDSGQSDALNRAIQRSRGEIILVLNADDALMPYACSWAVENLKVNPKAAIIYGDMFIMDENSEIDSILTHDDFNFERLLCVELVPPAQAAFIRRDALKNVGWYADATLDTCPDYEMWVRLTQKYPMKHVYGAVTKYRVIKNDRLDSRQVRTTQRFIDAKKIVMDRLFSDTNTPSSIRHLRNRAYGGLYTWAAQIETYEGRLKNAFVYLLQSLFHQPKLITVIKITRFFPIIIRHVAVILIKALASIKRTGSIKMNRWLAAQFKTTFEQVPITQVANYWNARPCNIFHSPAKIGTKRYFDEIEKRKYLVEPHIPQFAEFGKWKGKKVLEIGCGIGTDTVNFARAGAHVTTVELSEKSLALARKRVKLFGLSRQVKFYLCNAEELSKTVPQEAYDLIYSFGVIHHTPHPYRVIVEIEKYTHPKTIIKLMVYHRYSWKVLWIFLKYGKGAFWRLGKLISDHSEYMFGSPITYTYSKTQARKLLWRYKILEMKIDHIFPYRVPEYRQYRYKKVWYFRYLPMPVFRWLENNFGWHLLVTATV